MFYLDEEFFKIFLSTIIVANTIFNLPIIAKTHEVIVISKKALYKRILLSSIFVILLIFSSEWILNFLDISTAATQFTSGLIIVLCNLLYLVSNQEHKKENVSENLFMNAQIISYVLMLLSEFKALSSKANVISAIVSALAFSYILLALIVKISVSFNTQIGKYLKIISSVLLISIGLQILVNAIQSAFLTIPDAANFTQEIPIETELQNINMRANTNDIQTK